ncbi:unnamed protein product [Ilex paraguariensis]|uniref:Uncharacterized protein n=1 Tax=Ilex paraguariensis TaxID=185542 RepID=A0ABC8R132_9AQUA
MQVCSLNLKICFKEIIYLSSRASRLVLDNYALNTDQNEIVYLSSSVSSALCLSGLINNWFLLHYNQVSLHSNLNRDFHICICLLELEDYFEEVKNRKNQPSISKTPSHQCAKMSMNVNH